MFELKQLSHEAIPAALAKAERYRLLHEPWQAESICQDILAVDPENQTALSMLLLALTDQFDQGIGPKEALAVAARMDGEYERCYYTGIVHERRAIALFRRADFRAGDGVYPLMTAAMEWYGRSEPLRPRGNDDCLLRWNACARFLERHRLAEPETRAAEAVLSE